LVIVKVISFSSQLAGWRLVSILAEPI